MKTAVIVLLASVLCSLVIADDYVEPDGHIFHFVDSPRNRVAIDTGIYTSFRSLPTVVPIKVADNKNKYFLACSDGKLVTVRMKTKLFFTCRRKDDHEGSI